MHIIRSQIAKSRFYLAIAVILASAFLPVLSSATAFATVSDTVNNIDGKVSQWLYYRGIWACMGGNKPSDISRDDLLSGHWFPEGKKGFGYLGPGLDGADDNDGTVNCDDGSAIDRAAEDYFGFSDEVDMFCAIDDALDDNGFKDAIKPSIGDADCERSDSFDIGSGGGSAWQAALTDVLDESLKDSGGRPRFHLGDNPDAGAWYYWLGKRGIEVFCGDNTPISEGVETNAGDSDDIVNVTSVDPSTGEKTEGINYLLANDDRDQGSKVDDVYYAKGSTDDAADRTCLEMAALTKDNADAYSIYVKAHPDENIPTDINETDDTDGSTDPVCSAGALGWVFCPLTDFISEATTRIAGILESQLVYPALLDSDQGDAIRAIWGVVLGIANAGLAIAFLIVIFSQATSVGLSSYGIKKILPRVVIAAILMNLSFFLCAIAIDIANIIGVSIREIVGSGMDIIDNANPAGDVQNGASTAQSWTAAIVAILGLGLAVLSGAIFLLFPMILTALFAVFTAFLIIAARGVIVTLLVIVAPLAFLAWVLPNTESWFTKWRKLFTTMLLMFPLVMLIFYGSLLMSKLILVTTQGGGDDDPKIMTNIIALAVLTIPLFSLPFIMKSAGGILDRLGVIVNNRNKGLIDRSRKASQDMYNARKDTRRMNAFGGGKLNKINPLAANTRRLATRDHRRGLRKGIAEENSQEYIAKKALEGGQGRLSYSGRMVNSSNPSYIAAVQASAQATVDKQDRQSIANREILIRAKYNSEDLIVEAGKEFQNAVRSNDETAARAAQNILLNSGTPGLDTLSNAVTTMEAGRNFDDKVKLKEGVKKDLNAAGLKPKQNALATWSYDDRTLAAITVDGSTYAGLNDGELVGQTADNIGIAVDKGVISAAKAQSLLDNPSLQGALNDKKRGHLKRAISGTPPAAGGGPTPPTPATPPAGGGPTPPTPPTGGGGGTP